MIGSADGVLSGHAPSDSVPEAELVSCGGGAAGGRVQSRSGTLDLDEGSQVVKGVAGVSPGFLYLLCWSEGRQQTQLVKVS